MSHNFKRPTPINPQERRDERTIKVLATLTTDQGMLDALLKGADPAMRAAMLERITPYLPFKPAPPITDCPHCGFRRGSILSHECLAN